MWAVAGGGEIIVAGLRVADNGRGGVDVTYVACVDPKGWLPKVLVNLGAGKGAMCIDYLRKYVIEGVKSTHDGPAPFGSLRGCPRPFPRPLPVIT